MEIDDAIIRQDADNRFGEYLKSVAYITLRSSINPQEIDTHIPDTFARLAYIYVETFFKLPENTYCKYIRYLCNPKRHKRIFCINKWYIYIVITRLSRKLNVEEHHYYIGIYRVFGENVDFRGMNDNIISIPFMHLKSTFAPNSRYIPT